MNTKEKIAVMNAYLDGKKIQYMDYKTWLDWDYEEEPYLDWDSCDYRIKPELREWTVTVFADGHINSYGDNGKSRIIKVREVLE